MNNMDTRSDFSSMTRVESKVALVTGATSQLALNLCYRLIDKTPANVDITFILTASTLKQTQDAIALVEQRSHKRTRSGRVEFDYLVMDFTDMKSVYEAYTGLLKSYTRLDYIFLTETLHPTTDYRTFNWGQFLAEVFSSDPKKYSYPSYITQSNGDKSNDGLGLIFQANVFAPYYFVTKVCTLLQGGGKILWFSSTLSDHDTISFNDLQLLHTQNIYVKSQRLIDLLHFGTCDEMLQLGIEQYLIQPGITQNYTRLSAGVAIFAQYLILLSFYFKTLFGSPYHSTETYKCVNSAINCAVSGDQQDFKIASGPNELIVYDEVSSIGSEEVVAYLNHLCTEWNSKLKEQELKRTESILRKSPMSSSSRGTGSKK